MISLPQPQQKIHEMITKETWCKGMARDAAGRQCEAWEPRACAWCAFAWIMKVYRFTSLPCEIFVFAKHAKITSSIGPWNDSPNRTFEEVKAVFVAADI